MSQAVKHLPVQSHQKGTRKNLGTCVQETECLLHTFETSLGWMGILQKDGRLTAMTFGHRSKKGAQAAATRHESGRVELVAFHDDLTDRLIRYANGERVSFTDIPIDLTHLTPFAAKVVKACRALKWGETATYGELAKRAGSQGAARAVGSVMAKNRLPIIIPCHRILPAGGKLGGFSAPQGVSMKERMLQMEGAW